jgi:carboxyl-terminal processing protease
MPRLVRPLAVAVAVLAVLALGIWLGGHPADLPDPVADALVDKQARVVDEALDTISDTYYVKPSRDTLADNAIRGMVARLGDRFGNYLSPAEYARYKREQRSEFTGIGVIVGPGKLGLRIRSVYDKSPAKRAGVKPGDVIVRAGGHSLKGLDIKEASSFVTGRAGTAVAIELKRGKRTLRLKIKRATLSAGFTDTKLVRREGEKIGVVHLTQFGPGSGADLEKALKGLQRRGAKRFVLDLRDNGGGLVSEAQRVASEFLKGGKVVSMRGRSVADQTLDAGDDPLLATAPLVVLVNRNTASASEIVAGALQDRKRAKLVGTRTYGKGVFQQLVDLSNGGALDLTAGQYFTPAGRNLGGRGTKPGKGLVPDVKASDDPDTEKRDEALDRAVAVVAAAKA